MCDKQLREKFPAPGQYNTEIKTRPFSARLKRTVVEDKINYLDEVQYEAAGNPGVGQYNVRVIFLFIHSASISKS